MVRSKDRVHRVATWWARQRRQVRRAVVGYSVVAVFGAAYLLARALDSTLSLTAALLPASLAAAPLVIAFVGDRITGLKLMSIEMSLSEVRVELNDDISSAIQELGEMGPSAMPQIADRIIESIANPDRDLLLRFNLRDGNAWWSTRVFLVAALASDYTGIQQLVFVDEGERRHFIGLAAPMSARRSLAGKFPTYESAYRRIRSNVATAIPSVDTASEVNNLLQAWPGEFVDGEAANKEFVTRDNLSQWLRDCLEMGSVEWAGGPLTPLVRYQINSQRTNYVAMTSDENLKAVVDRVALATRAERDVLQARLS